MKPSSNSPGGQPGAASEDSIPATETSAVKSSQTLKALAPDKYRENIKQEITGKDGAPLITHVEIVKDYGPETNDLESRMEIIKDYGPGGRGESRG